LFSRPHHRRIATVLLMLDAGKLDACHCLFGGGTAMTLRYGEYRESVDIDFLVSDQAGYRQLRQQLASPDGLQAIARPGCVLAHLREVRTDQYGIRTVLQVEDVAIKFEIVFEARIALATPADADRLCGVSTLTPLDMAASKLLANADRWADASVFSRDLIDLAMMQPSRELLAQAMTKASQAYGDSVATALAKAIQHLQDHPHRLRECMGYMGMIEAPAVVWRRIKALGRP
jgi:hypothetical protein